jgi:hypothetical protein
MYMYFVREGYCKKKLINDINVFLGHIIIQLSNYISNFNS